MTSQTPSAPRRVAVVKRRPWLAEHWIATTVVAVVVVLVGAVAWTGWHLWQVADNLQSLKGLAADLQRDAEAGDITGLTRDLGAVQDRADAAYSAARDPLVQATTHLPWVGDDLHAATDVARVASEVTKATIPLTTLLPELDKGSLDLTVAGKLLEFIDPFERAASSGAETLLDLEQLDILDAIRQPVADVRTMLEIVPTATQRARPFLEALSILAAPGQDRHWLVISQNLGEARASGGLVGSWLLLHTDNGKIEVLRQGTNNDLETGETIPYEDVMPDGYQQIWGDYLGKWLSLNLSANFPDNARLMVDGWNARGEEQVDGVLSLGQGTTTYLVAATGPVSIGEKSITSAEIADYLTVGVYRDYEDPNDKDKAVAEIIAQVFGKLATGRLDVAALAHSLLTYESADYLQLWSPDSATQAQIADAGLDGTFGDELGPVTSVRLINAGANKLDAFAELAVDYALGACVVDENEYAVRSSTLTVTLTNAAPDSGLPDYMRPRGDLADEGVLPEDVVPGSNRDHIVVYAPAFATITGTSQDGSEAFPQEAWVGDRDMLVFTANLDPGQSSVITVTWDEQPTDDGDAPLALTPSVVLPPLVHPADVTLHSAEACG